MNKYMSPVTYVGLHNSSQRIVRSKTCFDTGELDVLTSSICDTLGLDRDEFLSRLRTAPLSDARKIFFYLTRVRLYRFTCNKLGKYMNRDHSTVVYAVQRCEELMEIDLEFRADYKRCLLDAAQRLKLNGYTYHGDQKPINYGPKNTRTSSLESKYSRKRASVYAETVGEFNC